jgi:phosphoadenosine phosphosulfate reductase
VKPLYRSVQVQAKVSRRVLVGFSGGKDSVACLDLCTRHFDQVEAFFMFLVRGLELQEDTLRYYERKYGIRIHRVPHFMLSEWLRYGVFRVEDFEIPIISTRDVYCYLRERTGLHWIAGGERIADSTVRRAMLKRSGSIDASRGRFYPLSDWSKPDVMAYIRQRRLVVGQESRYLGFSFRSLAGKELHMIRQQFPSDFRRICAWFPMAEASVRQYEQISGR